MIQIDLHCDLLAYLLDPNSNIDNKNDIGCSIPFLKEGNVALQVMAIYTATENGSSNLGYKQSEIFKELYNKEGLFLVHKDNMDDLLLDKGVGVVAAIENASSFCEEDMGLTKGFKNLDSIIHNTQQLLYIGLTHHYENRFGGGNRTQVGLKEDGKALIDFIADKKIAIDFAHTSDRLAYDILNYLSQSNLNIPILASHSNYRNVYSDPRNLPDDIVQEIILRKGLIGLNFIKDYINLQNHLSLYEHIAYGLELGAEESICFGADFFFDKAHPDRSRYPFFFEELNNANAYQNINAEVALKHGQEIADKISYKNVLRFLNNVWK